MFGKGQKGSLGFAVGMGKGQGFGGLLLKRTSGPILTFTMVNGCIRMENKEIQAINNRLPRVYKFDCLNIT